MADGFTPIPGPLNNVIKIDDERKYPVSTQGQGGIGIAVRRRALAPR